MKKLSGILILMMAIVIILPACKKYPDGPAISFRSKKARLVNQWKVEKVLADGLDITVSYQNDNHNEVVEFKDNGDYVRTYKDPAGTAETENATWAFTSDKKGFNLTSQGVTFNSTILKLKNDELWFKTTLGTTIWEYHYISN